ncbi:MAG: ATP-dependent dethiobiotin synthetase BioD [Kiritimatiellae bacterium]|nr:ATP-dependent dethiobiotin synthetase BioD [Kiritimatiellia bacterium]
MNVFVSAIDTDAGKTLATALLGRFRLQQGRSVITQKLAQTGCDAISEDVQRHREIMGMSWTDADRAGDSCPYVFPLAASPHLAAEAAGETVDPNVITAATDRLVSSYQDVIIEGVGGVCVPLTRDLLLVDYLAARGYRTVLVTSARLGSINHTLMSLESLKARGVPVAGMIYNRFFDGDKSIARDSRTIFERSLIAHGYPACVIDMPCFDGAAYPDIDFSRLFE